MATIRLTKNDALTKSNQRDAKVNQRRKQREAERERREARAQILVGGLTLRQTMTAADYAELERKAGMR